VTNDCFDSVSVLLGNGDGTFMRRLPSGRATRLLSLWVSPMRSFTRGRATITPTTKTGRETWSLPTPASPIASRYRSTTRRGHRNDLPGGGLEPNDPSPPEPMTRRSGRPTDAGIDHGVGRKAPSDHRAGESLVAGRARDRTPTRAAIAGL